MRSLLRTVALVLVPVLIVLGAALGVQAATAAPAPTTPPAFDWLHTLLGVLIFVGPILAKLASDHGHKRTGAVVEALVEAIHLYDDEELKKAAIASAADRGVHDDVQAHFDRVAKE